MADGKHRVVILGGGLAALSTAFELTATEQRRARYDVAVYQVGWRLGGKCASSRGVHGRIEEHGLHVLLGAYENAFAMMRRVYDELDRDPGTPLSRFADAFLPHDEVVFIERIADELRPWRMRFPRNDRVPGDGGLWPDVADYGDMVRRWVGIGLRALAADLRRRARAGWWRDLGLSLLRELPAVVDAVAAASASRDPRRWQAGMRALAGPLRGVMAHDDGLRRAFILLDLGVAVSRGMVADGVATRGLSCINGEDFRAWLRRHGASELATESALLRALYDLVFHAEAGQGPSSGFAAGTALRMALRFVAGYKGAIGWWMAAGTGETLIAPLYQALVRRGVRFHFFHRVVALELEQGADRLARVRLSRQVTVRKRAAYQPLVDVDGLACWPAAPLYDQLVEGKALQASGADLESSWSRWSDVGSKTLSRGRDFDTAVLAIPAQALAPLTPELSARSERWRQMLAATHATPTLALQVWSTAPRPATEGKPMMNTGIAPLTGYGDMSHLLAREGWATPRPRHVFHVCSRIDAPPPPPAGASDYNKVAQQRAHDLGLAWLHAGGGGMVPGATAADRAEAPRWDVLHDADGREADQRFEAQYWRCNVEPSDHYDLVVPGSTRYRLAADESGFAGLVLAGTWTRTGLDVGSVEAAVMSGRSASRAICGEPIEIPGERDWR